jgi:HK97 family phage major capsid protein
MNIILRKIGGRLEAVFRTAGGPSYGAGPAPGAVQRALLSPLVLALLAIALLVTWVLAHPQSAHHGSTLALPIIGEVAKLKGLQDKRATIVTQMRTILDTAETANRELTAEERTNYDRALADQETLRAQIATEQRQLELDREILETRGRAAPPPADPNVPQPDPAVPEDLRSTRWASPAYRAAYRSFLRGGESALSATERRDLDATTGTSGGFLRAPIQMAQALIKKVDDLVFIRGLATKFQVPSAASLGVPSLTADPADSDWTAELATGSADTAMAFGIRELQPKPLAKRIKVSNLLLRSAVLDIESLVLARLAYKRGITQEKAFLTGGGVKDALGIFTASTDGISTARDVSTGNTTTAITFDGLTEAKYNQKAQYWAAMRWLFHRDALKQVSKIKDGDGQYMWQPSRQIGQPDTLLALPFMMSEYAPNTFTTGKYVGIVGDFSWYWIADSLDLQIQRLVELYAETNQTGYITRQETDGMPVLEEAFTRVKLG